MNPAAVLTIVGLVLFSTLLGLLWRWRTGRVTNAPAAGHTTADLPEVPAGSAATLLQFSTAVCAPCVPTRALLSSVASDVDGVQHIDIDISNRADLAARFNILQTPTTLLLDADRVVRGRIGGAPRRQELLDALSAVLEKPLTDRTPA